MRKDVLILVEILAIVGLIAATMYLSPFLEPTGMIVNISIETEEVNFSMVVDEENISEEAIETITGQAFQYALISQIILQFRYLIGLIIVSFSFYFRAEIKLSIVRLKKYIKKYPAK